MTIPPTQKSFDYEAAFVRNRGWFRSEDQNIIKTKRVAIPGLGGVGGHHLHGFLRLGFEKFNLADPDIFEIQNFNRQQGATYDNLHRSKLEVAEEFVRSINPQADIRSFPLGVQPDNMEKFLADVDIVVDALDLFAMDIRIPLYELAHKKGIPVVTAGPLGMGTSVMAFNPDGISFVEYFDLGHPRLTTEAKIIRFLAGLSPSLMHRSYLRDPSAVNLFERRLPSLNIGCFAAAAALGALAVEIALDRHNPDIRWAPKGFHVDFNLQQSIRFWCPWGNRNPFQWVKIKAYHKFFHKLEYKSEQA